MDRLETGEGSPEGRREAARWLPCMGRPSGRQEAEQRQRGPPQRVHPPSVCQSVGVIFGSRVVRQPAAMYSWQNA